MSSPSPPPAISSSSMPSSSPSSSSDEYSLQRLPSELRRRVATYVSPRDAIHLSQTCKALDDGLCLRTLRPVRQIFPSMSWFGNLRTGDKPRSSSVRIPILTRRVHTLTLAFRWRDQGWGDRLGKIYIVATTRNKNKKNKKNTNASSSSDNGSHRAGDADQRQQGGGGGEDVHMEDVVDPVGEQLNEENENTNGEEDDPFEGGRIVCESPLAPHTEESYEMTFTPLENEVYHLWYRVGGGGGDNAGGVGAAGGGGGIGRVIGHALFLNAGTLRTLIFDDEGGNISRNYTRLHAHGAIEIPATTTGGGGGSSEGGHNQPPPRNQQHTFYPRMLLSVCRSLRRQLAASKNRPNNDDDDDVVDEELVNFFNGYDIPVNEASLLAVEEIIQADVEQRTSDEDEEDNDDEEETERNNGNGMRRNIRIAGGAAAAFQVDGGQIPNDVLADVLDQINIPQDVRQGMMANNFFQNIMDPAQQQQQQQQQQPRQQPADGGHEEAGDDDDDGDEANEDGDPQPPPPQPQQEGQQQQQQPPPHVLQDNIGAAAAAVADAAVAGRQEEAAAAAAALVGEMLPQAFQFGNVMPMNLGGGAQAFQFGNVMPMNGGGGGVAMFGIQAPAMQFQVFPQQQQPQQPPGAGGNHNNNNVDDGDDDDDDDDGVEEVIDVD